MTAAGDTSEIAEYALRAYWNAWFIEGVQIRYFCISLL